MEMVPPLPPPDAAEGSSTKRLAETEVADGLGGVLPFWAIEIRFGTVVNPRKTLIIWNVYYMVD